MAEARGLRTGCKYHFNIQYNHEDRIHRQTPDTKLSHDFTEAVVNKLEKKGYTKSYYQDRDAIPGRDIFNEHSRVIGSSSKTILIITQGFVDNPWRIYLSHTAFKVLLDSKTDHRIIPLILDLQMDVPQEFLAHGPVYFKQNWEDDSCKNTWERLFKAMECDDVKEELTPDLEAEAGPHPKADNDDKLRGEYMYSGNPKKKKKKKKKKNKKEEVCDGFPTTRDVHVPMTRSVLPDQRNVLSSSKPADPPVSQLLVSETGHFTSTIPTRTENYRHDDPSNEGHNAKNMEFCLGSDMDEHSVRILKHKEDTDRSTDIMTVSPVRRRATETSYIGERHKKDTRATEGLHEWRQHGHYTDSKTAEKPTQDLVNSCGEGRESSKPEGKWGERTLFPNIVTLFYDFVYYLVSKIVGQVWNSLK